MLSIPGIKRGQKPQTVVMQPGSIGRRALCVAAFLLAMMFVVFPTGAAQAETRTLKLYFMHTKERAEITFKRNGRYDKAGLNKLNRFLRDWRRKESTKMDPRLFDLLWEVYQASGSRKHIHVVSAYRSPATNNMLRSRSKGVAKNSQHTLGRAMDFFLPDVKLAKVRELGMKFQVGGVGYYPRSGSPFVHLDVGSVRAWPRMSRQELTRLFPNGKTLHIPPDGKRLPGYSQALSDYKRRVGSNSIRVAGGGSRSSSGGSNGSGGNLLASLFGNGNRDQAEPASQRTRTSAAPAPVPAADPVAEVPALSIVPIPVLRPAAPQAPIVAEPEVQIAALPGTEELSGQSLPAGSEIIGASTTDIAELTVPTPELRPGNRVSEPEAPAALTAPSVELAALGSDTATNGDSGLRSTVESGQPLADLTPEEIPVVTVASLPAPPAEPTLQTALVPAATVVPSPAEQVLASVAPQPEAEVPMALVVPSQRPGGEEIKSRLMAALVPLPSPEIEQAAARAALAAKVPRPGARVPAPRPLAAPQNARALTEKMVSTWALSRSRVKQLKKPVKGPRFVDNQMTAQPVAAYKAGFEPRTAQIDPDRFTGTAVHFPAIVQFNTY